MHGRMFRDRLTQQGHSDAKIAKDLRSAFIATYCGAVYGSLAESKAEIEALEAAVIRIEPPDAIRWNRSTSLVYSEPEALVDALMDSLGFQPAERESVNRQKRIFAARR
jgi:hypothetical protein